MHDEDELSDENTLIPLDGFFKDLFTAEKTPVQWVIEDLLPVGTTVILGPPKVANKSTLAMYMACIVAGFQTKALPPSLRNVHRPGPVLILSAEATAGELRYMVEEGLGVKGQPDESIMVADEPWRFRLDDENGVQQLIYWLDERKPRLLVVDPLRDFHNVDESDSGDMNRLLRPLQRWAKHNECATLIPHHTRKLQEGKTTYDNNDSRGSSAIVGLADAIIVSSPIPCGEGNALNLKATFKRAAGWERNIKLGIFGEESCLVLTEQQNKVLKYTLDGVIPENIAKSLKMNKDAVEATLKLLHDMGEL